MFNLLVVQYERKLSQACVRRLTTISLKKSPKNEESLWKAIILGRSDYRKKVFVTDVYTFYKKTNKKVEDLLSYL